MNHGHIKKHVTSINTSILRYRRQILSSIKWRQWMCVGKGFDHKRKAIKSCKTGDKPSLTICLNWTRWYLGCFYIDFECPEPHLSVCWILCVYSPTLSNYRQSFHKVLIAQNKLSDKVIRWEFQSMSKSITLRQLP